MTDIEWAVTTFLAKKHPEICNELLRLALDHSGLVDNENEDKPS